MDGEYLGRHPVVCIFSLWIQVGFLTKMTEALGQFAFTCSSESVMGGCLRRLSVSQGPSNPKKFCKK